MAKSRCQTADFLPSSTLEDGQASSLRNDRSPSIIRGVGRFRRLRQSKGQSDTQQQRMGHAMLVRYRDFFTSVTRSRRFPFVWVIHDWDDSRAVYDP